MKKCSKCGENKKIELFVLDKRREDGTRSYCKECYNASKRKTPKKPIPKEGHKFCAKCQKEMLLSFFNKRITNGMEKHFSYCKECERDYNNNRYDRHCKNCGKEYKSGSKNNEICKECHSLNIAKIGRENFKILNSNQFGEKNKMFGIQRFGKDNPNYKSDKTETERYIGRLYEGYGIWRKKVYERDNYTCVKCGSDKGGTLCAHHLDSYDWCKDKRLEVDNGATLCVDCHKNFHSEFGYGKNTKEQFECYMNSEQYANTEVKHSLKGMAHRNA